ncbi:hypothetical protein [Caballeronia sp. SBC2]|uniref:hypothetical protein n=1 Tax=Caballeronia sp. SBC2 TaxID=2705547 RepID=UPI0013E13939|nr:hypothetical protein [Caballeronia sp. SBC2]QIE29764.1 hypothetical protein SBC2_78400 [Caballeronia sp. SBC2]
MHLDRAIAAFRAAKSTGLRALDAASRVIGDVADDEVAAETTRRAERRRVPRRPDRVELAIFTALADTYGAEMLSNVSLGYALRLVARRGGISLVQRILWGESASDLQLAVMLTAARAAFMQIAFAFSDELLAEAKEVLAGFGPRPPRGGKSRQARPWLKLSRSATATPRRISRRCARTSSVWRGDAGCLRWRSSGGSQFDEVLSPVI